MKKFFMYMVGALFMFVSCQSDQLESDEALFQENDEILMKAMEALENYNIPYYSSMTSSHSNGNQVTRDWVIKYSRGTIAVVPNSDYCGDFDAPYLQFVLDGGGIASHIGRFTVINLACVDTEGNFVSPLMGYITAANGDVIHTITVSVIPDPDNPGFTTFMYDIIGGSEGGRFEDASGYLAIYGTGDGGNFSAVGWGEITY